MPTSAVSVLDAGFDEVDGQLVGRGHPGRMSLAAAEVNSTYPAIDRAPFRHRPVKLGGTFHDPVREPVWDSVTLDDSVLAYRLVLVGRSCSGPRARRRRVFALAATLWQRASMDAGVEPGDTKAC